MKPIFNYIITIHNSEDLIENVLAGIVRCCGDNSFIYPVLDGCTDRTEEIVDRFSSRNPSLPIIKVKAPDVHEILSINEALKTADQTADGYNIILQDDVVLLDDRLEAKVNRIYEKAGDHLGYLSFRLGANIRRDIFQTQEASPLCDYVESAFGHGLSESEVLLPGRLAFRSIGIKSPVCIPTRIIRRCGLLNESLAPCFHDDTEYCLRLIGQGYRNAVFAINYRSDVAWGGTRKKGAGNTIWKYMARNMAIVKEMHSDVIKNLLSRPLEKEIVIFEELCDDKSDHEALKIGQENRKQRRKYEMQNLSFPGKVKYLCREVGCSLFTNR